MRKRLGVIFLLLAVFLVFESCRTPAGRTPGEVVDDSTITTKVKAKLFEDNILKGMAISVDTFEGQVTLTKSVPGRTRLPVQSPRTGRILRLKGSDRPNRL